MNQQNSGPMGESVPTPARNTSATAASAKAVAADTEPKISGGTARKPSRRVPLVALVGMAVVALGLAVSSSVSGWIGAAIGDVLYAVLIYVVVCLLLPKISPIPAAVVAVIVCWLIEFFQLTGLPLEWAEQWPPAKYVFGTTFAWTDLLLYLLGVAVAVGVELLLRRRRVTGR